MKPSRKTLSDALAASISPAGGETFGAEIADAQADAERCGILVRVSPDLRRALKLAAIARDATVQDLMMEAIAIVLKEPAAVPKP
jgi:antitoxin-like ribbon-helix-helix protein